MVAGFASTALFAGGGVFTASAGLGAFAAGLACVVAAVPGAGRAAGIDVVSGAGAFCAWVVPKDRSNPIPSSLTFCTKFCIDELIYSELFLEAAVVS